jgi:hypothetical protein
MFLPDFKRSILYSSDSQPGVRVSPGVRIRIFRGTLKKLNNGGKKQIPQQCKTRYKLKFAKLI